MHQVRGFLGKAALKSTRNLFPSQYFISSFVLQNFRYFLPRTTALGYRSFNSMFAFGSKEQPSQSSKVLVFGAGNFGSCLASHLGDSRHEVYMWARDESIVKHFNIYHRNPTYLRDHQFPSNITAIGPNLPSKEFMNGMDVLLFAIPTQFLRYLRRRLKYRIF
jgi:hypothetical protein